MTWLDYSFARPSLTQARAIGATGVLRYIAPVTPQTKGKILTASERDMIFGADLDLALNFEWYEGRCLEGGAAGRQDAATALTQARALGYPPKRCIYFSHDTGQWSNAVLDYFDGVNAGLAGYYETGGYGGYGTVKALLDARKIKRAWQTLAWSNGKRDPRAVLFQNGRQWFGNAADENEVTGPVNGWRGISSGETAAGGGIPLQEDDMTPDQAAQLKTVADFVDGIAVHGTGTGAAVINWTAVAINGIRAKVGALTPTDVASISAAVVAALPKGQGSSVTAAQIADELAKRLTS